MKKLITIVALLLPMIFIALPAHAEWTKLEATASGNSFYINIEKTTTPAGYIHYWELVDFVEPLETGIMSVKTYHQADCKLFRHKTLRGGVYKQAMATGGGEDSIAKSPQWQTPPPHSMSATILKTVCKQ